MPVPEHSPELARGDGHPAVASALLAITWGLAVVGLVLVLVVRPEWQIWHWYFVVDLADAVVFGLVGYLLLARTSHPVAGLVMACGLGGGLAAVGAMWTELRFDHPSVPELELLQGAQNWTWIPGTLALILIVPWLVRDDQLPRLGYVFVAAGAVVPLAMTVLRLTSPFPWPNDDPIMPLAIKNEAWLSRQLSFDTWLMGATVVLGAVATLDLVRRWRLGPARGGRGLGWLSLGVGLMTITFLPLALPAEWTDWLPGSTTPILHLASQQFFPAALLVAVLGQQLWGLRLAVSRTVAWSLLTAVLIGAYIVLVGLSGLLMPGVDDDVERVAVTALVAAAIGPVRRFVQRRVDHLIHGEAREPIGLVGRVGRGIAADNSPTELLRGVLDDLIESLRLNGAAIVVHGALGEHGSLATGDVAGEDELDLPLVLDDEPIGVLSVWPRPGERLDGPTLRALSALAPTVAVAARLASTADELAASRARIAVARDEERRALRRELHDGLGPALAGVGYGLQAARNLLATDPAAAGNLLERLATELDGRVEEVRQLARELVPPALLEAGLVAALEELAARHRVTGLEIELSVGDVPALSPEMSSALYGIAVEALRNVVRHSAAERCRMALTAGAGGALTLTVVDDGVGIPDDVTSGVGLQSMRERAEAIGAALTIEACSTGGTRVTLTMTAVMA